MGSPSAFTNDVSVTWLVPHDSHAFVAVLKYNPLAEHKVVFCWLNSPSWNSPWAESAARHCHICSAATRKRSIHRI